MSFSDVVTTVLKIRRVLVLISVVAGGAGGYKYGPAFYHRVEDGTEPKAAASVASVKPPVNGSVTTNAAGLKLSNRDLGAISLTNHIETCVSLGKNKDCMLTPLIIDKHTVQLTVVVQSRFPNGKTHDLSMTQVVTPSGEPFDVAVGDFSFSLIPTMVLTSKE